MMRLRRMIHLCLLGLIGILSLAGAASAITLAWDQSVSATGYRLYYGLTPATYDTMLETGASTSASISGLTPGSTYYFAATAYNQAGESDYSAEVSSVIPDTPPPSPGDTTPPVVRITSPTDGSTVPRKTTVAVQMEASDNVAVTEVRLRVNGNRVCIDTSAPYRCTWNVPAQRGRTFRLEALAFDAAGNMTTSAVVTVTSR